MKLVVVGPENVRKEIRGWCQKYLTPEKHSWHNWMDDPHYTSTADDNADFMEDMVNAIKLADALVLYSAYSNGALAFWSVGYAHAHGIPVVVFTKDDWLGHSCTFLYRNFTSVPRLMTYLKTAVAVNERERKRW